MSDSYKVYASQDYVDNKKTSWNDLQDKPFYYIPVFAPLVWNGETEGREKLSYSGMDVGFKLFDEIIPQEEIVGTYVEAEQDGIRQEFEVKSPVFSSDDGYMLDVGVVCMNATTLVIEMEGNSLELSAPSPGMYLMTFGNDGPSFMKFKGEKRKLLEASWVESPIYIVEFNTEERTPEEATEYTANRTPEEIQDAVSAGKVVIGWDKRLNHFMPLVWSPVSLWANFTCTWVYSSGGSSGGSSKVVFSEYVIYSDRIVRNDYILSVITEAE